MKWNHAAVGYDSGMRLRSYEMGSWNCGMVLEVHFFFSLPIKLSKNENFISVLAIILELPRFLNHILTHFNHILGITGNL